MLSLLNTILLIMLLLLVGGLFIYLFRFFTPKRRAIEDAFRKSLDEVGFEEDVALIKERAKNLSMEAETIRDLHKDIGQMLRSPTERGGFGEVQLEEILADRLPKDMFGIRERTAVGQPDAHIQTSDGLICIDSKFPLDNYRKFLQAEDDAKEKYARKFRRDVEHRLGEVASKYVCPQEGTTEFAFAFIPSEGVYYYLIQNEYELLQEYTEQGVQVVSPITLLQRIQLIKTGIQAQKLTEKAEAIQDKLYVLKSRFGKVKGKWDTFYRHVKNAKNKADELDQAYDQLREEFNKLYRLEDIK